MLISSPRHTAADLRFWRELEAADALAAKEQRLRDLQAESLNALIDFTLDKPPCYCGVSWGKDSVVTAHLLRCIAPTIPLVHFRTTTHNPDCDLVRDAYFEKFPGQAYQEITVQYSAGTIEEDEAIWQRAVTDVGKMFCGRYILGLRRDESVVRKWRFARYGLISLNTCAPIGFWKVGHVFAYLYLQGLPVHPAYACLGGGRWDRARLRVDELADVRGEGLGRGEYEREYYGSELRRIEARETLLREAVK